MVAEEAFRVFRSEGVSAGEREQRLYGRRGYDRGDVLLASRCGHVGVGKAQQLDDGLDDGGEEVAAVAVVKRLAEGTGTVLVGRLGGTSTVTSTVSGTIGGTISGTVAVGVSCRFSFRFVCLRGIERIDRVLTSVNTYRNNNGTFWQ